MDVFELRNRLIADYQAYVTSFMALRDERIKERVETSLREGRLWPEPRIGLNPSFESGGLVDELVAEGLLHEGCRDIFRTGKSTADPRGEAMRLHRPMFARAGLVDHRAPTLIVTPLLLHRQQRGARHLPRTFTVG